MNSTCWEMAPTCQTSVRGYLGHFFSIFFFFENVEIPSETLQRYIVMPNRKCSYSIHQKSGTDFLPNALKAMGVCLFQGHTYWRMNKNALAWIPSSKTYYFTLKYDDLQRTNSEYMEDEKSRNWIPVGTGISDTGSGKIHHWNKMVERVDIIF